MREPFPSVMMFAGDSACCRVDGGSKAGQAIICGVNGNCEILGAHSQRHGTLTDCVGRSGKICGIDRLRFGELLDADFSRKVAGADTRGSDRRKGCRVCHIGLRLKCAAGHKPCKCGRKALQIGPRLSDGADLRLVGTRSRVELLDLWIPRCCGQILDEFYGVDTRACAKRRCN